ncbi:phosphate-binding protein PstS 2 [Clostridia bacterium]|nr:phosphate-binding protein PstS 2 [Clostridia bacterium]
MKTKKVLGMFLAAISVSSLVACSKPAEPNQAAVGGNSAQAQGQQASPSADFDDSHSITVISREDGSGTRSAFSELVGVIQKGEDGTRTDNTSKEAIIANKTDVMITNVSEDPYAVGYISVGSLPKNGSVRALLIDGVEANDENIKNGTYPIKRPFIVATKIGDADAVTADFMKYILSDKGQEIVAKEYIAVSETPEAYASQKLKGKIVVGGSSSVTPIMEKLSEAYMEENPDVNVEIQMTDSTAGMTGAIDGSYNIGMSSRDLTEKETAALAPTIIAQDGIAVIVNPANSTLGLSTEWIRKVFTGEAPAWDAWADENPIGSISVE